MSFAELYLALQFASSCEYMVGNTASAISEMMLFYGCFWNNHCPDFYNFENNLV